MSLRLHFKINGTVWHRTLVWCFSGNICDDFSGANSLQVFCEVKSFLFLRSKSYLNTCQRAANPPADFYVCVWGGVGWVGVGVDYFLEANAVESDFCRNSSCCRSIGTNQRINTLKIVCYSEKEINC